MSRQLRHASRVLQQLLLGRVKGRQQRVIRRLQSVTDDLIWPRLLQQRGTADDVEALKLARRVVQQASSRQNAAKRKQMIKRRHATRMAQAIASGRVFGRRARRAGDWATQSNATAAAAVAAYKPPCDKVIRQARRTAASTRMTCRLVSRFEEFVRDAEASDWSGQPLPKQALKLVKTMLKRNQAVAIGQ